MSRAGVVLCFEPGRAPDVQAAGEVAAHAAEPHGLQHGDHGPGLVVAAGGYDDLALGVHHPGGAGAHPGLVRGDVDRARDVGRVELPLVPAVDEDGARLDELLDALRAAGERAGWPR